MNRLLAILIFLFLPVAAHATVTGDNSTVSFACTGSTGPYPFTFPISDPTALTVIQNGTALASTAYTITPVNNKYDNGGIVTLNVACPSSATLTLQRNTPLTQLSIFTDNMPVPMATLENGLDKLTEADQDSERLISLGLEIGGTSCFFGVNCSPGTTINGTLCQLGASCTVLPPVTGSGLGNGTTVIDASTMAGATFDVKVNAAFTLCATSSPGGCIVDARGLGGPQSLAASISYGGSPNTYTLILAQNLRLVRAAGANILMGGDARLIGQSGTQYNSGTYIVGNDSVATVAAIGSPYNPNGYDIEGITVEQSGLGPCIDLGGGVTSSIITRNSLNCANDVIIGGYYNRIINNHFGGNLIGVQWAEVLMDAGNAVNSNEIRDNVYMSSGNGGTGLFFRGGYKNKIEGMEDYESLGLGIYDNGSGLEVHGPYMENVSCQKAWVSSTQEGRGAILKDSNNNCEIAISDGTTGSSAPSWPSAVLANEGNSTTDGTVTWQMFNPTLIPSTNPANIPNSNIGIVIGPSGNNAIIDGSIAWTNYVLDLNALTGGNFAYSNSIDQSGNGANGEQGTSPYSISAKAWLGFNLTDGSNGQGSITAKNQALGGNNHFIGLEADADPGSMCTSFFPYNICGFAPFNVGLLRTFNGQENFGTVSFNPLPTPPAPTAVYTGAAGSSTYYYFLVAHSSGGETLASSASTAVTGAASSLDSTHYVIVTWPTNFNFTDQISGSTLGSGTWSQTYWDVIRNTTNSLGSGSPVAVVLDAPVGWNAAGTAFSVKDAGGSPPSYSAPARNTSGDLIVRGLVTLTSLVSAGAQCLQVDAAGNVSGTGSSCGGSGASLFSSFQMGGNAAITATGTYFHMTAANGVAIGTTTGAGTSVSPYVTPLSLDPTSAYNVIAPEINVMDAPYSAANDNSTDDTAAIQAALTALESTGGTLIFPCGAGYKISSALTYTGGLGLVVLGKGTAGGGPGPVNISCSQINLTTTGQWGLIIGTPTTYSYAGPQIKNLSIQDNTTGKTAAGGIQLNSQSYAELENVSAIRIGSSLTALSPPSAPIVTATTGSGYSGQGVVYFTAEYLNPSGETTPSTATSHDFTSCSATCNATITSPSSSGNATQYLTFAGTAADNFHQHLQGTAAVNIGSNTLLTTFATTTSNPVTFNQSAPKGVECRGSDGWFGGNTGYCNQNLFINYQQSGGTVIGMVLDNLRANANNTVIGGNFNLGGNSSGYGLIMGNGEVVSGHAEEGLSGTTYFAFDGFTGRYDVTSDSLVTGQTGVVLSTYNVILNANCSKKGGGSVVPVNILSGSAYNIVTAQGNGTCTSPMVTDGGVFDTVIDFSIPQAKYGMPLLTTSTLDGRAPITITTTASVSAGSIYNTGFYYNQDATAAAAITYTLPTAATGRQYCFASSDVAGTPNTGALKIQTSASGQYLHVNGARSASGGYIISGGAAGDRGCVVGMSATDWDFVPQSPSGGTWTLH